MDNLPKRLLPENVLDLIKKSLFYSFMKFLYLFGLLCRHWPCHLYGNNSSIVFETDYYLPIYSSKVSFVLSLSCNKEGVIVIASTL